MRSLRGGKTHRGGRSGRRGGETALFSEGTIRRGAGAQAAKVKEPKAPAAPTCAERSRSIDTRRTVDVDYDFPAMPDPLPYAALAARPARPLLASLVLGLLALGLTAAACVLLFEVRPLVAVPPPALNSWDSISQTQARLKAHTAAAAWTSVKTLHVAVLYTAAAACLIAAAVVLRKAVQKLMSS
jgi:hypothetical protein